MIGTKIYVNMYPAKYLHNLLGTQALKRQVLMYHFANLKIFLQECSLVEPLQKLTNYFVAWGGGGGGEVAYCT